jgi:hypothetical protein
MPLNWESDTPARPSPNLTHDNEKDCIRSAHVKTVGAGWEQREHFGYNSLN